MSGQGLYGLVVIVHVSKNGLHLVDAQMAFVLNKFGRIVSLKQGLVFLGNVSLSLLKGLIRIFLENSILIRIDFGLLAIDFEVVQFESQSILDKSLVVGRMEQGNDQIVTSVQE